MMGTDNTQPPIPAMDFGSGDHVDPTTLALLADISLTVDANGALADMSLDEVRRFASDLLEDDPDIEDQWRAPALVDAATHIANCSTCAEAHGAVVVRSSTALRGAGGPVTVDAARMEQAIAAALDAFDAQTPVSHARTLPVAGEADAAHVSPVKPSRSAWWRTLVGSRPSTSSGGATGAPGGTLAFLRQRGVVVAAIGLVVIASAIVLRPGRVEQVSTVAIPATTTEPKTDDRASKAADSAERVELATESAAADTTAPAGFAAGSTEETAAAAAEAEAAPLEVTAAADAPATTGPVLSSDGSASAAAAAVAAPEADPSPTTVAPSAPAVQAAPPTEVVNSTPPLPNSRTKAAKKTAPTLAPVAAATDQSPVPAPGAPATSAAPSASGSASPAVAAAPATAAPSAAAAQGSSATTTRSAEPAPFDVPPSGDAASAEELLKRFSDAVARDPSLNSQITGRLTAPTTGASLTTSTVASALPTAAAVAVPSPSTPSTAARPTGATSTAVACSTTDNEQIVAIGSGTIAGRPVVIRIVRTVSATSATPAPTFIELLDPASCNLITRQATP